MEKMKTLSAERPKNPESPKDERASIIRWLAKVNPALIPAAFAASMSAGEVGEVRAESIEEIHGQEWLQGVETLRESVMNADIEVGATFVLGEEGTQFWYSSGVGNESSVGKSTGDIVGTLSQFTEGTKENISRFCDAHTHSLSAIRAVDWISDEELATFREEGYGPSIPPSLADIDFFVHAEVHDATYEMIGEDISYFQAVFDAQGVWYSRLPIQADYDAFPVFKAESEHRVALLSKVFGDAENEFTGGPVTQALQRMEEDTLKATCFQSRLKETRQSQTYPLIRFTTRTPTRIEATYPAAPSSFRFVLKARA